MLKLLRGILVGAGLWVCDAVWGEVDPAYRVSFGILGEVQALAEAPDGQLLVCGALDQVGPIQRRHLIRLMADGAVDPNFDVGTGFYAPSPSTLFRVTSLKLGTLPSRIEGA